MKRLLLLLSVPFLLSTMAIGPCDDQRLGSLDAGTGDGATGNAGRGGTTGVAGQGGGAVPCDGGAVIICIDGTMACSLTACPPAGGTGGGPTGTGGAAGTGGVAGTGGATATGGATGTGGVGGDCPDTRITQAEALALYTAFANRGPSTNYVVEEVDVPNLWEELRIQVFNQTRPSLSNAAFTYHRCMIREFAVGAGSRVFSGLVRGAAFYYSYAWGSGVYRSHLGRTTVPPTGLRFLETGGYTRNSAPPPLMVRAAGDQIIVEFGTPAGFNAWTNPIPFGTLMDTGDRLAVLDAAGQEIPPDFPAAP